MALVPNGWVLRPARMASSNATSTGEVSSGVSRDTITPAEILSLGYDAAPNSVVEPWADMYRAAVLQRPSDREYPEEFLLWAANTSALSVLESSAFALVGNPSWVTPSSGDLSVDSGAYKDGTKTFYVQDSGGREISSVTLIKLRKKTGTLTHQDFILGVETEASPVPGFLNANPGIGKITLNQKALLDFGGGFSPGRGDSVLETNYILTGQKFWWSKNDSEATRFGWNGLTSRWEPLKGSSPQLLGPVTAENAEYKLFPPPVRFVLGSVLPGDPLAPEDYALIRAGVRPDSSATPLSILVVSDEESSSGVYPSGASSYDGVVGVQNGILLVNPTWGAPKAGISLWYNPESFSPGNTGTMGKLGELPQDSTFGQPVLAPTPGPTDRPLIRLGSRSYLGMNPVDRDSDLPLPTGVPEGEAYWSRATGKIIFSATDIRKAIPGAAEYDIAYLGANVYYDGVSLTQRPLVLKTPSPALNENGEPLVGEVAYGAGIPLSGNLYLQRALPLPPPGTSGVLHTPDGSGDTPVVSPQAQTRPNGSGLSRNLRDIGDAFLFCGSKAFESLQVEEYDDEIPVLNLKISKTEAVVARLSPTTLPPALPTGVSRCDFRRRGLKGEPLYFVQAQVSPGVWSAEARIYSRYSENWVLEGTETLPFSIDGNFYLWDASLLAPPANGSSYSAKEIADSLNAVILSGAGVGSASSFRGRICIQSANLATGSVEIGWNTQASDVSGHSVLGFLPSWRVVGSSETFCWLPDCGLAFGLYRSPENLDRSSSTPDYRATASLGGDFINGEVLLSGISATPWVTINNPPLEDIPGFDAGVHFLTVLGLNQTRLSNWGLRNNVGVWYDWDNLRFGWTQRGVLSSTLIQGPTNTLQLGSTGVLVDSLSSSAMLPTGANYGLYLQNAGEISYTELSVGSDFVCPGDGAGGQAILVNVVGGLVFSGGGGETLSESEFWNPAFSLNASENLILQTDLYTKTQAGYLIQVFNGGNSAGVYTITGKAFIGGKTILSVSPDFPETSSGLAWEIREAQTPDVYDPTVLADVQQVPFSHFAQEPWKIRLLSSLGTLPNIGRAVVQGAVESDRDVSIRFTIDQNPLKQAKVKFLLQGERVGVVKASGLSVPDVTSTHFKLSNPGEIYFQIRIGGRIYSESAGNLALVTAFSLDPNLIEVGSFGSAISGEISVGSTPLSEGEGDILYYDEIFLASSVLNSGEAEIDPCTGEVRLSDADNTAHAGDVLYFVEDLILEGNVDAQINPLNGSFVLRHPLREFQIVESVYWVANSAGDIQVNSSGEPLSISEYLGVSVRLATATPRDSLVYEFNPEGRTLAPGSYSIWVGPNLQNFAGSETAVVGSDSTITFGSPVSPTQPVQINYRVLEAFGGETAFSVSSPPVFRKPFFLTAGQDTFRLEGDRTQDILPGQLFLIGPSPFYIQSSVFVDGETEVVIFPAPTGEVGSRSPGRESETSVSNVPLDLNLGGAAGFLLLVDSLTNPLLPTNAGNTTLAFVGDLTGFAKAGHLLEVAGIPYIVVRGDLVDGGRYTNIEITTPTQTAHTSADVVRISVRRVYSARPFLFEGISAFLSSEPYRLFILGSRNQEGVELPGRELVEGVHYLSDPDTGGVSLITQNQKPLQPWEKLLFSYTGLKTVSPVVEIEALICPKYRAQYLFLATPSSANRLLGSALTAKYTFRNPDSFYCQVLPLQEYLPKVAQIALGKSTPLGGKPGGPVVMSPGATDNSTQGVLGLRGNVQDLSDQDRAARAFVGLYNDVIVSFESVLEAIDGRIIGDKDGKFRFFVGHGKSYPPPGWEDEISGELNPRLLWRDVVDEWADSLFTSDKGWVIEEDPVFDPTTGVVPDPLNHPGETDGETPNSQNLSYFSQLQKELVRNDMDDRVLIGFGRPRGLALLFPSLNVPGLFKSMWENHPYSRLFPERTKHFSRLLPGIGAKSSSVGFTDPGYYTAGRKVVTPGPRVGETTESTVKTRLTAIGALANPALGEILGIQEVTARNRYPRARVWAFYPEGSSDLDSALNAAISANYPGSTLVVNTLGKATLVVTPLPLSGFPFDPTTGFPDITKLIFDSKDPVTPSTGTLFSIESGDPELSTPKFEKDQRVQWGTPDGTSYALADSLGNGIFVDEVLAGCVITLKSFGGSVTGSDILVNGSKALVDVASGGTGRGDTLFVGVPVQDLDKVPGSGDSPTVSESTELAKSLPDYAIQKDLIIQKGTGQIIDASWPTRGDVFPIPLQEWFGQNPPKPLTCIEGEVDFSNTGRSPLELPCLKGEGADDSGDVSIPYLGGDKTELDLLGEVAAGFRVLLGSDSPYTPFPYTPAGGDPILEVQNWKAIYPDEIVLADGEVGQISSDPSTLYTGKNLRPVQTSGYTNGTGVGDARRFDLILVEADQPLVGSGALPVGMTGILSVGEALWDSSLGKSTLEVPRFVTPAPLGGSHKYTLKSAWGWVNGGVPTSAGLEITETHPGNWVTLFDFSTIANLFLDDGTGSLSGGVLGFLGVGKALVIKVYDPDPATPAGNEFLGAIVISQLVFPGVVWVWDPLTSTSTPINLAGLGVTLSAQDILRIEAAASLLSALSGVVPATIYDFSISLDSYFDTETDAYTAGGLALGAGAGSNTCEIARDRLTFSERVSLLRALERGTKTANGNTDVSAKLNVHLIENSTLTDCTVNACSEINGGQDLTFSPRIGPSRDASPYIFPGLPYTGTFVPATGAGAGNERGTLRAMSWEGFSNNPIPAPITGVKISAISSSDLFENSTDPLLDAVGTIPDDIGPGRMQTWVQNITINAGSLDNPCAGDTLVVDSDLGGKGAIKSGTYLVRHVIPTPTSQTSAGVQITQYTLSTTSGTRNFLDLSFPTLKSFDGTSLTLVGSGAPKVLYANTVGKRCGFPDPIALGSNQWVWVISQNQFATWDSATTTYSMIPEAISRAEYSDFSYDELTGEVQFTLTGIFQDSTGAALTLEEFSNAAVVGKPLSGMTHFPVNPRNTTGLPPNNTVGAEDILAGTNLTAGFFRLTGGGKIAAYSGGGPLPAGETWQKGTGKEIQGLLNDATLPTLSRIGIRVPAPEDNTEFYPSKGRVVYARDYIAPFLIPTAPIRGVGVHVSTLALGTPEWDAMHFDSASTPPAAKEIDCLLPGDAFEIQFWAVSGIFLEPSFARPATDLNATVPHVVSSSYTALPNLVGIRNAGDFTTSGATSEEVHFYVRRIRRFHEVQTRISDSISLLKWGYEMRKGEFLSYDPSTRNFQALPGAEGATNLGDFTNPQININAGDVLRVLDKDRNLLDKAEIQTIVSGDTLKLRRPGLDPALLVNAVFFEVYLAQPLVPQEQSCAQLLENVTESVVLKRTVDYSSGGTDGGYLPGGFNAMQDTLVTSWAAAGVQEGDYLLIDPAGTLYSSEETGVRPIGDTSVEGRTAYVAGTGPNALDDNRGFYRVGALDANTPQTLTVNGGSRFGGGSEDGSDDVIFGEAGSPDSRYAVLPTIHGSALANTPTFPFGGREGQGALRPTAPAIGGRFGDRIGIDALKSIEPFGYTIIRPSSLFSQDALELVLFMRERMLSWIEEAQSIYKAGRGGDYWVFQDEDHIKDIGSPTDPSDGKGVLSNLVVSSLEGLVSETPFANVSDCLSIQDRRFWVLDTRLDSAGYTQFADNAWEQRPVLPDLIDEVLNLEDRFRPLRYAWISFRADKVSGSIVSKSRAEAQLPEELRKQKEYLDLKKGLDGA